MLILDVTVGSRKIYHGWDKKLSEQLIGVDERRGCFDFQTKGQWAPTKVNIRPTVRADMKYLPFKPKVVNGIIIDPPHLDLSLESFMTKAYGSWTSQETVRTMRAANIEFARVLKEDGWIILKVMPDKFPLYETLLNNFLFFLPIQTKRVQGTIKNPRPEREGALFAVGSLKSSTI